MIFRRIKAHVEKENWFAVGIDFFIVVIGVFLGIQIGNWNEARVSSIQETEYLEQLRNEIATNAEMTRYRAQYVDRIVDCLLYTSPSPRDGLLSRMPSSA